ncbi:MAG TPA: response regulator [Gemmatimonadales bacterium]|nr:response regulator [Gemmatimonadales bacterium]
MSDPERTRRIGPERASADLLSRLAHFVDALPGLVLEQFVPDAGPDQLRAVGGQLQQWLGVSTAAAQARPVRIWAHVHPADRQRYLDQRLEAIEDQHGFDEELRIRHRNGQWRRVRVSTSAPERVEGGVVLRTIAVDITATHDLEHAHWEAQRREAMGRLASGIAHSFNNMLSVILPNLELLQDAVPPSAASFAMDARQAAMSATELVRQVGTLARRDGPPIEDLFDIVEVVDELLRICRNTFDRAITITAQPTSGPIWVLGRRSEILQILLNLALNARDAMRDTLDPQLTIAITDTPDTVSIIVEDNGEGMSAEVQRHLGEPFFSTRAPSESVGLGIATNLSMLREVSGELSWTSTLGHGSRFVVTLPTRVVSPVLKVMRSEQASRVEATILVIDDEPLVRGAIRRQLEHLGHHVIDADLGERGLALLASRPEIGLVMVDLMMPRMSGQEVVRRIRQARPELPVVVMSGFVPDDFKPGPHTRVLFKPFLLDELGSVLRSLLR